DKALVEPLGVVRRRDVQDMIDAGLAVEEREQLVLAVRLDDRVDVLEDARRGSGRLDPPERGKPAGEQGRRAADEHDAAARNGVVDDLLHDRRLPAAVRTVEEVAPPVEKAVRGEVGGERPEPLDLAQHDVGNGSRQANERVHTNVAALEDDFPHVIAHERVEPGPQLARERVPRRLVAAGAGAHPPLRAAARLACHPGRQTSAPSLAGPHVAAEVVDVEPHVLILAIRCRHGAPRRAPRPAGTAATKTTSSGACSLARSAPPETSPGKAATGVDAPKLALLTRTSRAGKPDRHMP